MFATIGAPPKPDDLVGLLLECHQRIRMFSRLAEELGRRDDLTENGVIEASQRCERYFSEALPLHVEDEEQSLLPRLRGQRADVDAALDTTHAQHAAHAKQLLTLLEALRALRAQPASRQLRERLLSVAQPLVLDFERHLALEEAVIFPAVRTVFSSATQLTAIRELRARRQRGLSSPSP